MKHAYLIIAHNEPVVLQTLVSLLDDSRNDIFIHWDKKAGIQPEITTSHSSLIWTSRRVDVRWGDVSQIESEYALFEEAFQYGNYAYFHLISGTHLPLKTQNEIHSFFNANSGSQIMQAMACSDFQIDQKMRRFNLFTKELQYGSKDRRLFFQRMWRLCMGLQRLLGIHRHQKIDYMNASNWVSLTKEAVEVLINSKKEIISHFQYTLCGDEFFVPTVLSKAGFQIKFMNGFLKCEMGNANPRIYEMRDYGELMQSECLFARKFSEKQLDVVKRIEEHLKI